MSWGGGRVLISVMGGVESTVMPLVNSLHTGSSKDRPRTQGREATGAAGSWLVRPDHHQLLLPFTVSQMTGDL